MDRTMFPAWNVRSRGKVLFEAWERQIAEMAGCSHAFPPTLTPDSGRGMVT